ncbi:MAG: FAD-binding and (Fe-S)-binding domain-containing protein [Burkholderiales bacterium]
MPRPPHHAALPAPYDALHAALAQFLPAARLVTDPLRLLAWGTDASFYRLVPKIVAVVASEAELVRLLQLCAQHGTPVTFRAAGTSLSGQAVSDSVLVLLTDDWQRCAPAADGATITLQPGVIGAVANRSLARFGRKIGPDPASIDAAMIGGIAANNASGMCCGTAQNSYRTLAGLRAVLADGTIVDTRDPASRAAFARARPDLVAALSSLAAATQADAALAARIRHKFRIKNTTGYSLNALVDFTDPCDILAHLMIGSEGTLGFISELTYHTVPDHRDKATALILFADLRAACAAVTALARTPVAAVELADRAALRSVEGKPGLPPGLSALPADGAALLVETRAEDAATLALQVRAIEAALAGHATQGPVQFVTDPAACARLWNVRKGMLPTVGAMRVTGTTVIIEDVAFPVERLADATLDLQALLRAHGYHDAIIFGHALAGNLHFVFTQDFNHEAEVARYRGFMDALAQLVVAKYDGSLKAEHGTGRNVAPFVELEWGAEAYALMRGLKRLFDPSNLLNPGVLLTDDPLAHVKHLKPLPAADALVDKCIECGFCEPKCPSRGLTLSPRQRIVGWREVMRLARDDATRGQAQTLREAYAYDGLDTCAACGLCATACPVGIETGLLVKALRGAEAGTLAHRVAHGAGAHFAGVTTAVRGALGVADALHGVAGTRAMRTTLDAARRVSGERLPQWTPAMPRPLRYRPPRTTPAPDADAVVYVPSCASRTMGPARGVDGRDPLPEVAQRLFAKAGYATIVPAGLDGLCCGQPFESKGFHAEADRKSAELEEALRDASADGRRAIVFDTSPCAWRMRRYLRERLAVQDCIEFVHDVVLPRVTVTPVPETVALHPVCSVRKMGLVDKLASIAARCSTAVAMPEAVGCCGFAGDRGFTHPELNRHALRHLRPSLPADCAAGYSTSRTCEIGLADAAGVPYESILYLVDRCTTPHASAL